jgi:nucleotide-binding universal stress UspA family protein
MFRHIVVPTDGSRLSSAAVDKAIALARAAGERIAALTVVEPAFQTSAPRKPPALRTIP